MVINFVERVFATLRGFMATTVNNAFTEFRQTFVDLKRSEVDSARQSRDNLQTQLSLLDSRDFTFPKLTYEYKGFGSFFRRTKIDPLDDIDMLVVLNPDYLTFEGARVRVSNTNTRLSYYTDNFGYLNSRRVINAFVSGLRSLPHYARSEIKRNYEAAVLNLTSYAWSFDLVPAIPMRNYMGQVEYYLIPDGQSNWKRTDPRIDQANISIANQKHNSNLIPLIRLVKYWNYHKHGVPTISSFYLETMLIMAFRYQNALQNIKSHLPMAFAQIANLAMNSCADPSGLGANLDASLDWYLRIKLRDAANIASENSRFALQFESNGDHRSAMLMWSNVFPNFPQYC